ncbi:Radical SAM domain protein [Methylobacterium sp. 4-46]|uniref:TIGR04295 family B12-binding domain-containing radical SAM protein n=1 Tax=unclassified Methylobacterium TaxID=2615210 RepID=UPI000165C78B|nr:MULTISPECIES: TIGR04295 family B12-binding domain-containing radical SAM protein [Methylobacterium]ACA16539.1 Radical SAM domain protein [Methylobacterium sp. 4-46]WFT82249.1 TIGR04295 family B12-binding domain-containing radical SAM protein [Methylobacterium nodulans]
MRIALVNPTWTFTQSIYFGCREAHLPIELGACKVLLEAAGHEVLMRDGALDGLGLDALAEEVAAFRPAMTVVTTAPTYLFWRCAQPELRVPRAFLEALGDRGGTTVAVGPHGSVTPETTLAKLGCDLVVRGECEEVVAALAAGGLAAPARVPSLAFREEGAITVTGGPAATHFTDLPALAWPDGWIARHHHHHHRFDRAPDGPGAEVEASRGCPYSCTFCAKIDFRDTYRRRELPLVLAEIDRLIAQGVTYIYFIDEIFLPQKPLLEALVGREVAFGVQTRIDLWKPDMLDLLGRAGCVSIEAGVESLTEEGRALLDKNCRASTDDLAERLIHARRSVPFVQANLIKVAGDDPDLVAAWRDRLRAAGVWANDPVPLYPYPSSPDYRRLWGAPDGQAWERAHAHYLAQFDRFSEIQEERPAPLTELESACCPA